jgi:hypothetical protein
VYGVFCQFVSGHDITVVVHGPDPARGGAKAIMGLIIIKSRDSADYIAAFSNRDIYMLRPGSLGASEADIPRFAPPAAADHIQYRRVHAAAFAVPCAG